MKKVLVVDDEQDVLKVVSFRLKKAGYDVATAANGRIALDMVAVNKPDLMLLDIQMPVLDGFEVCKAIKGDEDLKNIPIILLTAKSSSIIIDMVNDLKADDYMVKPFNPEELLDKVRKYLEQ
ncbi:MAG: response regulator [Candidatus Omnitrophota bacterium]|jgi:DNA-binding response OmpR family regulator